MPIPVIMPKFEMSQETALVLEWMKVEGESVRKGEVLLRVETDKITLEVESPADGILAGVSVRVNDVVPVTSTIAYLLQVGETIEDSQQITEPVRISENQKSVEIRKVTSVLVTPIAKKMAAEHGIDLEKVKGTGNKGEITRLDVENEIQKKPTGDVKPRATPAARKALRDIGGSFEGLKGSGPRGRIQRRDVTSLNDHAASLRSIRLLGMRRTIAERMLASYQGVPHIFLTISINISALDLFRSGFKSKTKKTNAGIVTLTAFLIKFTSDVLHSYPLLNSSLQQDEIVLHPDHNIGVAVALKDGLIVPVIKRVNEKSLNEVALELNDLAAKARNSTLMPADVAGGTFTISNLGPYGVEEFTAIIHPGQTAILAVGAAIETPVVIDHQVVIRLMMKMTLGVDHRVVDGAGAAQFLADLKKKLENPRIDAIAAQDN